MSDRNLCSCHSSPRLLLIASLRHPTFLLLTALPCLPSPALPCSIHALSATTFVQAVEQPTLAILVPLLVRGLIERSTPIKRKTAIIVANMAKLVPEVSHAAPLIPKLLPGLKKLRDEVSDPEARNVATKAFETLLHAAGAKTEEEAIAAAAALVAAAATSGVAAAGAGKPAPAAAKPAPAKGGAFKAKPAAKGAKPAAASAAAEEEKPALPPALAAALSALTEALSLLNLDLTAALTARAAAAVPAGAAEAKDASEGPASATAAAAMVTSALEYVAGLAAALTASKTWKVHAWEAAIVPYVMPLIRAVRGLEVEEAAFAKAEALAVDVLNRAYFAATGKVRVDSGEEADTDVTDPDAEDATIPDLCKCEFSLAYGGKILLNSARLHMKKGRKYGLIGPNGCGKSTLMKAISNGRE